MPRITKDTIAAIATPVGIGAILLLRLSGEKSISAVDSIFHGRKRLARVSSHTAHYGKIYDTKGELVDDVLVTVFRAPNSYTGEDGCEISIHGNPFIAQKILSLLMDQGIRLAEPGEFTKRAFLNGRLDLAQAEAVVDIIHARTEAALRGARNQLEGVLSEKVSSLRSMLIEVSSLVELELDFSEEDVQFLGQDQLKAKIRQIITEIDRLLETYSYGKVIRDGVNLAIIGKPNVGKSSLLNYLVKDARAIVSPIPGTTRDVIKEDVVIEGILFRVCDTAGIRQVQDEIEKEGVERSKKTIQNADIVLFLNDVQKGIDQDIQDMLLTLTGKERVISVLNKIDLGDNPALHADVRISVKTGEGMEQFFKILKNKAWGINVYTERSAIVCNLRHYNILKTANRCLYQAIDCIEQGLTGEFVATDLRNATLTLGEIVGAVTTDDILDNIFSKFCIGK